MWKGTLADVPVSVQVRIIPNGFVWRSIKSFWNLSSDEGPFMAVSRFGGIEMTYALSGWLLQSAHEEWNELRDGIIGVERVAQSVG